VDVVEAGRDERHRITGGDGQLAREERVRDGGLAQLLGRGRRRSDVHVFGLGLRQSRHSKRDRGGSDHGAEEDHGSQKTHPRNRSQVFRQSVVLALVGSVDNRSSVGGELHFRAAPETR
jgi:hypothetical protein